VIRRLPWRWPPVVDEQQIDLFYRGAPLSMLVGMIEAVVLSAFFWRSVPAVLIAAWLAVFAALRFLRVPIARAYRRARRRGEPIEPWIAPVVATALLPALGWGLGSFVLWAPDDLLAEAALHVCLLGIVLGGASHLANYYPVMVAHTVGVLVPLAVRDMLIGGPFHWFLAVDCVLLGLYALVNGRRQARAVAESYAQRHRNAELIEALQRENEATRRAQREAEAASAARARFFAAANHDLRQPLHAMGLLAQTLHARSPSTELKALSNQVADCAANLGELVDELLELSRLDAGSVQPRPAPFALDALLRECAATYAPLARHKGLALHCEAVPVQVLSDRRLVLRVLSNLVGNAVRYTPRGRVTLRAEVAADKVRVRVQDTGVGIAPEQLPRIFEEFYQVDNPARQREQGLGLGLATVRRLADLLQLQLEVTSTPGQGSEFGFELPLCRHDSAALPAAPEVSPDVLAGKRILVLEDDTASCDALVQLLEAWGCAVRAAPSAAHALDAVERGFRPEALIADLRLADGPSGDRASLLIRDRIGSTLPVLLVSGDAAADGVHRGAGVELPILRKPVRPMQLRAVLNGAFASS
jgi:signal transduction histidine kinase